MEFDESVEKRLEWMAEEILLLKERVEELSGRLAAGEERGKPLAAGALPHRQAPPPVAPLAEEAGEFAPGAPGVWLSRLAAACFLLVVALLLRTVSGNGLVEKKLGSLLGCGYALALIAWGWRQYALRSRLAPVFPVCGILLLLSIVHEAHGYFALSGNSWVYAILLAAAVLAAGMGLRWRAPALVYLGSLGPAVVALALDFPESDPVGLAVFVFAIVLAGYLSARLRFAKALSWTGLLLAGLFWLFWGYKLSYLLAHNGLAGAEKLGLHLFLPILAVFWLFYLLGTAVRVLERSQPLGVLPRGLPAVTLAGAFGLARLVVEPWCGGGFGLALLTLLAGGGNFLFAAWLVKRDPEGVRGAKEFLVAGVVALLLALPVLTRSLAWSLPLWAVAAYLLFCLAERWRSGGTRVISYLLATVSGVAGFAAYPPALARPTWGVALAAGAAAAVCLRHYQRGRHSPPAYNSEFFALCDKHDRSGVLPLLAALVHGFNLLRLLVLLALGANPAVAAASLACVQSVIVNLGAAVLMAVGWRARRGELLAVAAVVLLFGAGRVFLVDLFRAEGVPLVLSVFSFGIAAATASLAERRWRGWRKGEAMR